jgi:hypothetical protein
MKNCFVFLFALFVSTIAVASEQTVHIQDGIRVSKKLHGNEEVYRAHYIAHGDNFQFVMVMEPGKIEKNLPNGGKVYLRQHLKSWWFPKEQYPNGFCSPLERRIVQYVQATCHDQ